MSITPFVLICAAPLFAGWCVTAEPQSAKASALALGTGHDFFTWEVAITPRGVPPPSISREQLIEKLPFSFLKEYQARDVLNRRAAGGWSVVAGLAKQGLSLAPSGVSIGGALVKDWRIQALGGVLQVGQYLITRAQSRAANPQDTERDLFPDQGAILTSQGWDGLLVTGLIRGASKIGPLCEDDLRPAAWYMDRILAAREVELKDLDAPIRFDRTERIYGSLPQN